MKWMVRFAALYLVTLIFMVAVGTLAGHAPQGGKAVQHELMDPVSHSDYEFHRSIAHVP